MKTFYTYARAPLSLVIRTCIVQYKKARFDKHSLDLIKGNHRLYVILFVPKYIQKGTGIRMIGRLIGWGWEAEPGCETLTKEEMDEVRARVAQGEQV